MTIYRSITPVPPEPPKKQFWKRPVVWLVTIVVGAIGVYLTDVIRSFLEARGAPATELGERLAHPRPISIVDIKRVTNPELAGDFVVPAGVTDLATLDEALAAWRQSGTDPAGVLDRLGAVGVDRATWEITIEGLRSSPVEVVDMRPVLDGPCTEPTGGTALIENPSAGATDKIVLETEVDRPAPAFGVRDAEQKLQPFFTTKKITLPLGEKNVVMMAGHSDGRTCRWRVEVEYLADGGRDRMLIALPGDKPFQVTGAVDPKGYAWVYLDPLQGCDTQRVAGTEFVAMKQDLRNCP